MEQLPHDRILTAVAAAGLIVSFAVTGSVLVRLGRRLLMLSRSLRPYLPGAAAPVNDHVELAVEPLRGSLLLSGVLGWLAVLHSLLENS